ncbi:MAG: helix-turn-helix domain-containing protein [Bacteroidetes bacterium]|nr:helix-turn-helix domain-containing protein [Bacteroidota bacterium]
MKIDNIKLRKFREKIHLSQVEFAESIGVSQATIWEWERGDCDIKLEYFVKLIEVYGDEINTLSKDGTIINIINQHSNKIGKNAVVGFNVTIDPYQLQKDYIDVLKQDNEFHRQNITQLFNKMTDLISKLK